MNQAMGGGSQDAIGHTEAKRLLVPRDAPPSGKADAWGELNLIDETCLEFSRASTIPRGPMLMISLVPLALAGFMLIELALSFSNSRFEGYGPMVVALMLSSGLLALSIFGIRFDLGLPKDRPVRFNRRRGVVYANEFRWSANPFGRWSAETRTLAWHSLHAEVTKQIGASGEVITQRYALDLVVYGTHLEEVERVRLQQGAQTTVQYDEQWELIRRYMAEGPAGLPPQPLRDRRPGFVDCLLFAMPWFAPTETGRQARRRMRGFLGTLMATLMSVLFPLWLVFGLGNVVVMRVAPEATWPPGMDEASRA